MNPSPYPATREYDIDVDVTLYLTLGTPLAVNDPRADADAYVNDDLVNQIRQLCKRLNGDLVDIEWNIIELRAE